MADRHDSQRPALGAPHDNASVAARLGGEPFELPARGLAFAGYRASPGTGVPGAAEAHSPAAPRTAAPGVGAHGTGAHGAAEARPGAALPVLLVHGWPEFAAGWEATARELLAAGYEVAAYDQRGYSPGARPDDVRAYDVAELVADMAAVAQGLGWERFHLVGHDWGGIVGWAFAAVHPERLASFTSAASAHPEAHGRRMAEDPDQRRRMEYMRRIRRDPAGMREALLDDDGALLRSYYQGAVPAALVDSYVERLSEPGAMDAVLSYYRQFGEGAPIAYRPITVPALYLWGSRDAAFTRGAAELTADYVEGPYRFVELTGATHWLPEEKPDEIAAAVLDWASRHPD
ncbi:alpha/beta fold hydrolase [Brevibacterium sp. 5221]|uniref:Alpha/beta fold hydrolase n=1 Tax=Brevibacterium rongguiense TaxID=2695267 RepID=A0A6N9H655_9MICO|nr:alpha/beta hydrolase [Brevibacterium rongguiense]MYM19216.1 alpha/beta fold hydrolase [Brevibacterium rongguiense]